MTPILVALAVVVLWWPPSRSEHRLGRFTESEAGPSIRPWRPGALLAAPIVVGAAFGAPAGIATVLVCATVASRWRHSARARMRERETADLLLALSVMIAELSVGAPPARACASAAAELDGTRPGSPVSVGLATMAARAELGGEVIAEDATNGELSWRRVGIAWQLADRHGLPMVELLTSTRADLLARRQFAARTRAGLAGPRATATVLAGLPVIGVLLGEMMGAHPLAILTGGGLGGVLLVVGTALSVAGLMWSERITDRVAGR
ncbi:type II secretion system F family protein [Gordonia sp. OPL2]|uniref:type II secretion system F family protein n=1 Tax=Gordonia sp. OPL2 TaxID=2486274 RepID=UPI001654D557|nr:type II secretion system protein F [Gordonia sp. OPL2]ROZ98558.1 type II secretion system protein F [Gordonia sp. OPL2]